MNPLNSTLCETRHDNTNTNSNDVGEMSDDVPFFTEIPKAKSLPNVCTSKEFADLEVGRARYLQTTKSLGNGTVTNDIFYHTTFHNSGAFSEPVSPKNFQGIKHFLITHVKLRKLSGKKAHSVPPLNLDERSERKNLSKSSSRIKSPKIPEASEELDNGFKSEIQSDTSEKPSENTPTNPITKLSTNESEADVEMLYRAGGLEKHLHDPDGYKSFRAYITRMCFAEAINFWDEVEKLQNMTIEPKIKDQIFTIYTRFISPTALEKLNISATLEMEILEALKKGIVDCNFYEELKEYILTAMALNSLTYTFSDEFSAFKFAKLLPPDDGKKKQRKLIRSRPNVRKRK